MGNPLIGYLCEPDSAGGGGTGEAMRSLALVRTFESIERLLFEPGRLSCAPVEGSPLMETLPADGDRRPGGSTGGARGERLAGPADTTLFRGGPGGGGGGGA